MLKYFQVFCLQKLIPFKKTPSRGIRDVTKKCVSGSKDQHTLPLFVIGIVFIKTHIKCEGECSSIMEKKE